MTPAAELWAAVVKHCATGRGYRMTLDIKCRLALTRDGYTYVCVEEWRGSWIVVNNSNQVLSSSTADEAVRAALRIVAPSTEPNVSC